MARHVDLRIRRDWRRLRHGVGLHRRGGGLRRLLRVGGVGDVQFPADHRRADQNLRLGRSREYDGRLLRGWWLRGGDDFRDRRLLDLAARQDQPCFVGLCFALRCVGRTQLDRTARQRDAGGR
ncbi:MAG: hypothetical protein QM811_09685 [Pirellulales bacterium]